APSAAVILADLGADVIKIEPLAGDPMRGICRPAKVKGSFSGYDFGFDVDNRGKRSIALDLQDEGAVDVVHRLCRDADIFICNLLPERQAKYSMTPDDLWAVNRRLIHATLTGYGTTGPESWRPGYDVTAFFGRSGLTEMTREGDDGLLPMPRPAQGDHVAGMALAIAILAALRQAEKTGEGHAVETSLFESAVWTQATDLAITVADGAPVRRRKRHEMISATSNRFRCGDEKWLMLNAMGSRAWEQVCVAMGLDHLIDDPRSNSAKTRFDNMAEVIALLDQQFATKTRDEWGAIFDEAWIVWGPILSYDEVVRDPQAEAITLFPEIEHPERGTYRTVRTPMRIDGKALVPRSPAPAAGQHTHDILLEAGFDGAEIGSLLDDGAAG
ncbi:MAG: CoA transferase, partial [Actinomycetia bacterium]|nr:CoA transferase [Actinomycetes bacterium]